MLLGYNQSEKSFSVPPYKLRFVLLLFTVADPEGVRGVCSNPALSPNYFIFMGNLRQVG